jgi:hypothetical protein
MDTKNIDRLFQEKLKDLEMSPSPAVWSSIENSLAAKNKKRVIFWWWRTGAAIAAILLIGVLWTNIPNSDSKINNPNFENTITDSEETTIELKTISSPASIKPTMDTEGKTEEFKIPNITSETLVATEEIPKIKKTEKPSFTKSKTNAIAETPRKETNTILLKNKQEKTIFETLEAQNQIEEKETAVANTTKLPNTKKLTNIAKIDIEEVLKKEELLPKKKNNWIIAPSISQLRPSSFSNNSSIDQSLDAATKKGNNGSSFGVKIAFQASNKWQLQSGVHRLQLGQTTQNIALNNNSQISSLANLSFDAPKLSEIASDVGKTEEDSKEFAASSNSDLKQTYGYIEVPLEVKYALLQSKKLEFHLVSGISTLFLTTNNLQVQNENLSYSIGEASNLNSVDFSVNFGTDFEYHFSNRWFFNMAPMLKLQTNTFNSSSNKPYFFGVYTGLNYKF